MRALARAALLAAAARGECSGLVEVTWTYQVQGAGAPTTPTGYAVNLAEVADGPHRLLDCGVGTDGKLATAHGGRHQKMFAMCASGELSLSTVGALGDDYTGSDFGASLEIYLVGDSVDATKLTDRTVLRSACGFDDPGAEADELFSPGADVENLLNMTVTVTLSERLDVPYGALDPSDFSGAAADVGDTLDYIDQVRALDPSLAADLDVEVEEEETPLAEAAEPPRAGDGAEPEEGAEPPAAREGDKPPQAVEGKKESEDIFA